MAVVDQQLRIHSLHICLIDCYEITLRCCPRALLWLRHFGRTRGCPLPAWDLGGESNPGLDSSSQRALRSMPVIVVLDESLINQ